MTGDNVNDARYEMRLAVEERFGVGIHEKRDASWHLASVLRNLVASGDTTYDVAFCMDNVAPDHVSVAYRLDDLPYLDLDKEYWDKGMNDASKISGSTYFICGAYHLSHYDMTHMISFGKGLIGSLGLDDPYEIVRNDAWTIDRLFEMGRKATFDVDGDGEMTGKDSWGYVSTPKQVLPCFWIAFGERAIPRTRKSCTR
ncbi:MAG: hypothetical protein K6D94_07750 [Clostridiales bacterium]|nr:hypothetical protein [Clostridiales bacterium]